MAVRFGDDAGEPSIVDSVTDKDAKTEKNFVEVADREWFTNQLSASISQSSPSQKAVNGEIF